jgi:hypothetical protein
MANTTTTRPVTKGQAFLLMRLLNTGSGFSGFIPNWSDPVGDVKASVHAAKLLSEAGATSATANSAINYLKASKPTSMAGKAARHKRGIALLMGVEVAASKEEQGQVDRDEMAALLARVKELEAKLADAE